MELSSGCISMITIRPDSHAQYGEHMARIVIDSVEAMDNDLPRRALRLVQEWAALHREGLTARWESARAGLPLDSIEPLA
jgi:hypothetical protein